MIQKEKRNFKTSEFAKYTSVSIRTLRHYEEIGILKPSFRTESGHRRYNFEYYMKMQSITMLKFVGLALSDRNRLVFLVD